MLDENVRILALWVSALFASVTGFIIYFVVLYRNKQLKNKQEQEQLEAHFQQELLKAQIEIQEQTLSNISNEIHDNITQVLFFIKLNLKVNDFENTDNKKKIEQSRELIGQTINDLRNLSKSLSFEHITKSGLKKALEIEVERLDDSGLMKTELITEGSSYPLGIQKELVLFRIYQETLNNTLKHSGANQFKISLQYLPELFTLTVEDNGSGFDIESAGPKGGLGLDNIKKRASLIGAAAEILSEPGKGSVTRVTLNPKNYSETDANLSNRPG